MSSSTFKVNFKHEDMWLRIEEAMLPASAYGMLAVSALWAFILHFFTHRILCLGFLAFGLFFITGILGLWHYVKVHTGISTIASTFFKASKFITNLYCLPFIVSDLYINYNFSPELIFVHLILPLLALVPYGSIEPFEMTPPPDKTILNLRKNFSNHKMKDTMDFVMFCNVVSMAMVSVLGNNFFGVIAAFVFAFTHFLVTEDGYVEWMDLPAEPIYVSGMGVFCLLGMRAMMASCD